MWRTALLALAATLFLRAQPAAVPGLFADFTTPRGTFTCELFPDRAPLTVTSFVGLAEGTLGPEPRKPFFNGLTFHRVVPDFVIQGGDPLGTGEGGPGYKFPDEFTPGLGHDAEGVLSMANDGPDTNGSQFFLTLREVHRLDFLHSVFGRVVKGREVLAQVRAGDPMHVAIRREGAAAKSFRADPAAFAVLQAKARPYTAAKEPGPEAACHDPTGLLPVDPPRARAFNFKLANVERATGVRIRARFFAHAPSAAEDAQPGQFMKALAARLGTDRRGAVAAYFADEDEWRVWIGDESAPAFAGRPGTAAELTASGAMHEAKEAFLKSARTQATAELARLQANPPGGKPLPARQGLKLQADALLDGLIARLVPRLGS